MPYAKNERYDPHTLQPTAPRESPPQPQPHQPPQPSGCRGPRLKVVVHPDELRHHSLKPDAEGWLTQSSLVGDGLVLREQSRGDADRVQIERFDAAERIIGVSLGNGQWRTLAEPTAQPNGHLVWHLPLAPGEISDTLLVRSSSSVSRGIDLESVQSTSPTRSRMPRDKRCRPKRRRGPSSRSW